MRKIITQDGVFIEGVTSDSREVKPNFAFVAISGFKEDGNKYISEAVEKGAAVIYTEKKPEADYHVPVIQVNDARHQLAKLAAMVYKFPSEELNLIGASGTNGKTSTTYLIQYLLNSSDLKTGLFGTIDYKIGDDSIPATLTTPDCTFTQYFLRKLVESKSDSAVMEVSSHGVKLQRVKYLDFDVAIFTNLSPDHYDLHPDFPDYLTTKRKWFDSLKNDACLLYNLDDYFYEQVTGNSKAETKVSYGLKGKGQIQGQNIRIDGEGIRFDVVITEPIIGSAGKLGQIKLQPQSFPVKVSMYGEHNCYNALAAVAAALIHGVTPEQIQDGLANFPGVWRRFEFLQRKPFMVVDDITHNSNNYKAVFETAKTLPYNRMWVLVAVRGNRGIQINHENASMIGMYKNELDFDLTVTTSVDVNAPSDKVYEEEEQAFTRGLWEQNAEFRFSDSLKDSLQDVVNRVGEGDLLLLLGGHPFDDIRERIKPLLERKSLELEPEALAQYEKHTKEQAYQKQ